MPRSGLTLAATVLSSVAQPAFRLVTDRARDAGSSARAWGRPRSESASAGLFSSYVITWLSSRCRGSGSPRSTRRRPGRPAGGGNSNQAMSIFALGGNVGYALGPLVATPVLLLFGLRGTLLLVIPAL